MNSTSPLPLIRLFGASSLVLLSVLGLTLNGFLVTVLYRGRKSFHLNAFFTITWQLIFADVIAHFANFAVPVPVTFAGYDIYHNSWFHLVPCGMETFAYCGTLLFSFLMTLNRITVFIAPAIHQMLFKTYLIGLITTVWLSNGVFVLTLHIFGCYKFFNSDTFHYQHICSQSADVGYFLRMILFSATTYLPVVMFVAYVTMIAYIRFKLDFELSNGRLSRRTSTLSTDTFPMRKEFQLLAQGFLICAVLELESIAFNSLPKIQASDQWAFLISFMGNWLSLLLCSFHPIVLFTFNREIRRGLKQLFSKRIDSIPSRTTSRND